MQRRWLARGRSIIILLAALTLCVATTSACGGNKAAIARNAGNLLDDWARQGRVLVPRNKPSLRFAPVYVESSEQVVARLDQSSAYRGLSDEEALQVADLGCKTKDIFEIGQARDLTSAARTAIFNFGGRPQFQNRVRQFAGELEEADSPLSAAGSAAVFAFCEAVGSAAN
jgi:hypothetical protein